ncbi:MAG TPA: PLDc N-terminal domain-containing protein [Armatimonadota bacterium]|nr:PLDc N-terminal domain-containing protein [Armatimonadota bacterium]
MFSLGPMELLITLAVALLSFGPAIWAFIDMSQRRMDAGIKVVWVLVILFFPCLGALAYLIVGRKSG